MVPSKSKRSSSVCPAGISLLLSATGSIPSVRPLPALIAPTNWVRPLPRSAFPSSTTTPPSAAPSRAFCQAQSAC